MGGAGGGGGSDVGLELQAGVMASQPACVPQVQGNSR